MLRAKTHQFLLQVDDKHGVWQPSRPNRKAARVRKSEIQRVKDSLEGLLGIELSRDSIQDASFFTALYVSKASLTSRRSKDILHQKAGVFEIRFSSFGRLVSIVATEQWLEHRDVNLNEIVDLLKRNRFQYVDANELQAPYDGLNHRCRDLSWWTRYFDYF